MALCRKTAASRGGRTGRNGSPASLTKGHLFYRQVLPLINQEGPCAFLRRRMEVVDLLRLAIGGCGRRCANARETLSEAIWDGANCRLILLQKPVAIPKLNAGSNMAMSLVVNLVNLRCIRRTAMSILVNKHTKVITQGMTGETGTFHTEAALAYGTADGRRRYPRQRAGRRILACRCSIPWQRPCR